MTIPTLEVNPSAPQETKNDHLEPRLEKKINHVKCFSNSINNIKEMNTYFKDRSHKSQKKYKNYKTQTISKLDSVGTVVIIGSTTTSVTLSLTAGRLIVVTISAGLHLLYQ